MSIAIQNTFNVKEIKTLNTNNIETWFTYRYDPQNDSLLFQIPIPLFYTILEKLSISEIAKTALTCKKLYVLCQSPLLFYHLLNRDYPHVLSSKNTHPYHEKDFQPLYQAHFEYRKNIKKKIFQKKVLNEHSNAIRCMQYYEGMIVTGGDDGQCKIWDATSGKCLRTLLTEGENSVWRLAVVDGTVYTVSASICELWDINSGQRLHAFADHTDYIHCLKVYGKQLITGSFDHTVRVWDLESKKCQFVLKGHQNLTTSLDVKENVILSISYQNIAVNSQEEGESTQHTIKAWDISNGRELYSIEGKGAIFVVKIKNGEFFVTGGIGSPTCQRRDLKTGTLLTIFNQGKDAATFLDFYENKIVIGSSQRCDIWDGHSSNPEKTFHGHLGHFEYVKIADGLLISGSEDSTCKVWDFHTCKCLATFSNASYPIPTMAATSGLEYIDGQLITSSEEGTCIIRNFQKNAIKRCPEDTENKEQAPKNKLQKTIHNEK